MTDRCVSEEMTTYLGHPEQLARPPEAGPPRVRARCPRWVGEGSGVPKDPGASWDSCFAKLLSY
jgi:hypothetical protein